MHSNNNIDLEKIQFKNKNTSDPNFPEDYYPINASSLNQLQSNVDEYGQKIQDDLRLVEKSISNITGKLLWTNYSPTSSFGGQTIVLNDDDYDCYEILFLISNATGADSSRMGSSGKILKGYAPRLFISFSGSGGANVRSRNTSFDSNTAITFEDAYSAVGTTGRQVDNTMIIPLYVIGYKTGLFD